MRATNTELIEAARRLIVDDEIANIGVLQQMLEQQSCVNVVSTADPWEALSLEGRIMAPVAVFDALTHACPYKLAWPAGHALAEITRQSGRQFDPTLVAVFLELAGIDRVPYGVLAGARDSTDLPEAAG